MNSGIADAISDARNLPIANDSFVSSEEISYGEFFAEKQTLAKGNYGSKVRIPG
jgi:hypothetical protein